MCENTPEMNRIDYASGRIFSINRAHDKALRAAFNMDADKMGPRTTGQVLDQIKAGKITFKDIPEALRDQTAINAYGEVRDWTFMNFMDFRDPSAPKPDKEGYDKAKAALKAAETKATDTITFSSDPKEQLKALEAFQSATFH